MIKINVTLTIDEFKLFQTLIYKDIGIYLQRNSIEILQNKFSRQLRKYNFTSYKQYYEFVMQNDINKEEMFNIVTTNETSFFREQRQFDFLINNILPFYKNKTLDIWSAASSMGAEAYTLSMILNKNNIKYNIFGSDINSQVIQQAKQAFYPYKYLAKIVPKLQIEYCVMDDQFDNGFFLCDCIKENVKFELRNLIQYHSDIGMFDIVFLRNVLIYFNDEMKTKIMNNILQNLKVGGYLFISVTEHINNLDINLDNLEQVNSSIFQKVA